MASRSGSAGSDVRFTLKPIALLLTLLLLLPILHLMLCLSRLRFWPLSKSCCL